jgi:nucleotide-binding universal stress UspA family protein
MLAIKNILFPIDFSQRCCGAAPFVRAMALQFGARITLMSVISPFWPSASSGDLSGSLAVDVDELKRDLKMRLEGAFVRDFAGLAVDRVAEIGDPAEVITRYAHTQGADLIMMPTHGYGDRQGPARLALPRVDCQTCGRSTSAASRSRTQYSVRDRRNAEELATHGVGRTLCQGYRRGPADGPCSLRHPGMAGTATRSGI